MMDLKLSQAAGVVLARPSIALSLRRCLCPWTVLGSPPRHMQPQYAAGFARTLAPVGIWRDEVCPPDVTFREPPPNTTEVPLLPGMLRGMPVS